MEIAAAAVGVAAGRVGGEIYKMVDKTVTVNITNKSRKVLDNPTIHSIRGQLYTAVPNIKPGITSTIIFQKTALSPLGVVGSITYCIRGTSKQVAIYFENPAIGKRIFGLRWYGAEKEIEITDIKKWRKDNKNIAMATDMWAVGKKNGNRKQVSDGYVIRAFMSDSPHAELNVTFRGDEPYSDDSDNDIDDVDNAGNNYDGILV